MNFVDNYPENEHKNEIKTNHQNTANNGKSKNEISARWVVFLTAITMVLEIFFGYWTNSMALLADGYHMASHVLALGLTWIGYIFARKLTNNRKYVLDHNKIHALFGFASAIILLIIAIVMLIESIDRFFNPIKIKFEEAIVVAIIGLLVNGLCALVLHHRQEEHDLNIRSAYLHVLADGLTSLTAIIALTFGLLFKLYFLDCLGAIISSTVISKWSINLIRDSGKVLLDIPKY
ncbi:MAG: cation diffusion facilitator family transporter [Ignavibacteria bacterium]|nr:cation diffusion facilitator family transporter [Ignavibacteria bacterium]